MPPTSSRAFPARPPSATDGASCGFVAGIAYTQPDSLESLRWVHIAAEVNDLAVTERIHIGHRRTELDAVVSHLHLRSVDRNDTVAGVEDPLQLDNQPLTRLDPAFRCPDYTVEPAIGLTNVVGRVPILVDDIRIEKIGDDLRRENALPGP